MKRLLLALVLGVLFAPNASAQVLRQWDIPNFYAWNMGMCDRLAHYAEIIWNARRTEGMTVLAIVELARENPDYRTAIHEWVAQEALWQDSGEDAFWVVVVECTEQVRGNR